MIELNIKQIQEISSDFRSIAKRLCRTDYSQCDANLKRFINYIDSCELICEYIDTHNTCTYDIKDIVQSRKWLHPFEISTDIDEEISFEYQLLKYAVFKYNGDFTRLYGTYNYTSAQSTANDEMNKFINHIIDPFIDYINDFLHKCYMDKKSLEDGNVSATNSITANNSTVVLNTGNIEGDISNQVIINDDIKEKSLELVKEIKTLVPVSCKNELEDIYEILSLIEKDLSINNKPKKGFISALKTLCSGAAAILPLITTLLKILYP